MIWGSPWWFLLLLALPAIFYWRIWQKASRGASFRYSFVRLFRDARNKWLRVNGTLMALRLLGVALLIVALARPQKGLVEEQTFTEGVDIVICADLSSSMLARDFKPDRITAARTIAADFVKKRSGDRIGLVVFAGQSYTQCPLTTDYGVVLHLLDGLTALAGGTLDDGTAIGMGLASAVNRLRASKAKSKVIILITDGVNNRGEVDPITAAHAAAALGVRIYAIGTGTQGTAMFPVQDPFFGTRYVPMPVEIDDASLTQIAMSTGGKYYRATDEKKLQAIYDEIDRLERTKVETKEYRKVRELFPYPLAAGLAMLMLELILANTILRRLP